MKTRVLIIDDSDSMRSIIRGLLVSIGIKDIAEASNGQEAFAVAWCFKPDLILVDWNMPVMDGLTFVKKFRERDGSTPILMITTESDKPSVVKAIHAGISSYLTKPFNREKLAKCVRELAQKRPRAA